MLIHTCKKSHNFLNWLCAQTPQPCFWISVFLLNIPLLNLMIIKSATYGSPPPYIPNPAAAIPYSEECPYGRVYAYDLPSMFNNNLLLHNCTNDLDLANSQCGIVTNHGLGGAATELHRVLPDNLSNSWYRTNQFSLELIFHRRILQHKCRTLEPESAAAFYIPFYAGLAVRKFGWFKISDINKRDFHCMMLLRWVQKQHYWKKSNGSDHFLAIGRPTWDFRQRIHKVYSWGSALLNTPAMNRVTRFIVEKSVMDDRDVGVPWPTGFHPGNWEILENWQNFVRQYNRSSLFTFVGGPRPSLTNDFRGILLRYCTHEPSCRAVDCKAAHCETDSSVALESFLGSEFCLQPRGDSLTRRSVFDCMIAGSVPVIFWNQTIYGQYEWFLPGEPGSYSVFIDKGEVRNRSSIIKEVLMGYSKEEIRNMREKVIESIPRIIYGIGNEGSTKIFKDAFDIAFDGVLEMIKKERELSHIS